MKFIIPKVVIPRSTDKSNSFGMCGSCAYRFPCTKEEDEMTVGYYLEVPLPHPCHELRDGTACFGCEETFQRLGLEYCINPTA